MSLILSLNGDAKDRHMDQDVTLDHAAGVSLVLVVWLPAPPLRHSISEFLQVFLVGAIGDQ